MAGGLRDTALRAHEGARAAARYTVVIGTAAALGGLMFGFDVAIITGAGPFIEHRFALGPLALGWAFSSLLFGCIVGAAVTGTLVDRFGRKPVMVLVAAVFAATTIATGLAPTFRAFVIARALGGLAVGAVSVVAPLYVAEVAPAHLRGRLGALYQMAIVTGILLSYLVNYLLQGIGEDAWRVMFYSGALPALAYLALVLLVPETPRFLVQRGDDAAARRVLARTGEGAPDAAIAAIRASLAAEQPTRRDVFGAATRRPLAIGVVLAVLIHLTGINTIIEYAPSIFRSAGFTLDTALLSTFVVGVANFTFTLISFALIDRIGRRRLYIVGSVGMAAILAFAAVCVAVGAFTGAVALALVIAFLFFFAACIGPVFWTLLPELFPNGVRAKALTVPVLTQWGANAVVVLLFPAALHHVGAAATFALFAAACAVQAVFTWHMVPETKDRALEDIGAEWERRARRSEG